MEKHRTVAIYGRSLFAAGIVEILREMPGLEVVHVDINVTDMLQHTQTLRPDVVVIDGDDPDIDLAATLPDILSKEQEMKILVLNPRDTFMKVYEMHQIVATDRQGLLDVIQGTRESTTPDNFAGKVGTGPL